MSFIVSQEAKIRGFTLFNYSEIEKTAMKKNKKSAKKVETNPQLVVLDSTGCLHLFDIEFRSEQNRENLTKRTPNEVVKKMYEKMPFSDITLVVQGEKIHAHRYILATSCQFFEKMFSSGMEESRKKEIIIEDMSPEICRNLVKYIYFHEIEWNDKLGLSLLEVSDKYCFSDLTATCEKYLIESLNQDNCVEIIVKAKNLGLEEFLKSCLDILVANMKAWKGKISLAQFPPTILTEIIRLQANT